jgi:hypothetical protein
MRLLNGEVYLTGWTAGALLFAGLTLVFMAVLTLA